MSVAGRLSDESALRLPFLETPLYLPPELGGLQRWLVSDLHWGTFEDQTSSAY